MCTNDVEQKLESNKKLVYFTIHKYFPRYINDEDVFQMGMIGLWNACVSYQDGKGKFSTYAVRCIRNEICKEFRKREKASRLGVVTSLSAPVAKRHANGSMLSVEDSIQDRENPFRAVEWDISSLRSVVSERNLKMLQMVLDGYKLSEIAEVFGCTKQAVSYTVLKVKAIARAEFGLENS